MNGGSPYNDPDGRRSCVVIVLSILRVLTTRNIGYGQCKRFFSWALDVILILGCSTPVTMAIAIGVYPLSESSKGGILHCEYNFKFTPPSESNIIDRAVKRNYALQ